MENAVKTKWGIDPAHSEIGFKVKHLMITNVKGTFREFEASVYTSGDDFTTSEIDFRLNPASIDTGAPDRDAHLKSADFFDVENHKQITFADGKIEKEGDGGEFILKGNLIIRGISKPIRLNVEYGGIIKDPWGNEKAGFTIEGKINRKDWDLNWNTALETGGVLVSDEVKISCEIELAKQV